MRVAYIAPSLDDTTGWGRWVNDFIPHMRSAGALPVVLAPPSARAHCRFDAETVVHFVLPELFDYVQSSTGLRRLWAQRAFRRFRLPDAVDLVHSLDAHPWGLYGDRLARHARAPHVMTTHGRYGYIARDRWADRTLYAAVLTRMGVMVAVSHAVRKSVVASFSGHVDPTRVTVMQNPVDTAMGATDGGILPAEVPVDGPVIISVTRFIPVKDIETAVRAFAIVRARVPNATYFIIGPGNGPNNAYCQAVRDLIVRERIEGVHIVGRVPKDVLTAFYRRAALLVHTAQTLPDDFEASGLILLEAGLFRLPVVASASGGIPEVVEDDVTGRLVPERDSRALGDAIIALLGNPDARRRLGDGNLRRARDRNWTTYCAAQMDLNRSLLTGHPVRPVAEL